MESIRGKHAMRVEATTLAQRSAGYAAVLIDLGTGDGRFVSHIATRRPDMLAIGIDLCAANVREASRRAPANALYLIASAHALPDALQGLATFLTINFPWGDLLTGLLAAGAGGAGELAALTRPGGQIEIRLNGGALATAGWTLSAAGTQVARNLRGAGFHIEPPQRLDAAALRAYPTTWAHRLAFGRDPCALYLRGVKAPLR